jgi:hypothetical protein
MSRDTHSCTHWLRPRNLPLSPRIGSRIRGRYWSAICNPLGGRNRFLTKFLFSRTVPSAVFCSGKTGYGMFLTRKISKYRKYLPNKWKKCSFIILPYLTFKTSVKGQLHKITGSQLFVLSFTQGCKGAKTGLLAP